MSKNLNIKLAVLVFISFTFSVVSSSDNNNDMSTSKIENQEIPQFDDVTDESKNNYEEMNKDKEFLDESTKKIMVELGLDKRETLNRESFRKIFSKIIYQEDDISEDEKVIFDKLINKVVENAPSEFAIADLNKYIDIELINKYLQEYMIEEGINPSELNEQMKEELSNIISKNEPVKESNYGYRKNDF